MGQPLLSVIVAFHDMPREAPRTLRTLSAGYQRGVSPADYEVIAVDVGSEPPLAPAVVEATGGNASLRRHPRAVSPAAAINAAVREMTGGSVMVCIDGARMLTPGVVRLAKAAVEAFPDRFVATLSWHLGPKVQNESILEGYDQQAEDRLLASIAWQEDGYRLFTIGSLAQSSRPGWLGAISESNCIAMRRETWQRLGGYDERFVSPGGGLVNPDFFKRACDLLGPPVLLLGEGTFHQVHGGVATNTPRSQRPVRPFLEEYAAIRGEPFAPPTEPGTLFGGLTSFALPPLADSLARRRSGGVPSPLAAAVESVMPPTPQPSPQPSPPAGRQRVIAILGMHRSGTSLLAGTLEECGLDLGDVNTSAPANKKGNRESWALMALHEDLLRKAGGSWNHPPGRPVVWGPLHRGVRDAYIDTFAESPVWGFKDPRAVLLLEGWLEALPDLETIGIFRHPQEVATSLRERSPWLFNAETALALWLAYNRRLLAWHEERGCPLLEYLPDGEAFKRDALALARRLSLPGPAGSHHLAFHDPGLRHQEADESPLPAEVLELYQTLRSRAAAPAVQDDR